MAHDARPLTDFQRKCLDVINHSLNHMNNSWNIAAHVFGERWDQRRGRAGMVSSVQRACDKMLGTGHICARIPAKDQYDWPTYSTFGKEDR